MPPPNAGLCDSCAHQQLVPNTRGSVFSLCRRSQSDDSYPRYPRLPVSECLGHETLPMIDAVAEPITSTLGIDPESLIPPRERWPLYAKKLNFGNTGRRFLRACRRAGLKPDHRLLDLGCGAGRLAVALAAYLDENGSYLGLDAAAGAIELCDEFIGSKLPNFAFEHVDVHNTVYNAQQGTRSSDDRFPCEDASVDFVFSNSLFTHLVPTDAERYLLEIGRVLRPGGVSLNTMFLLNDESIASLEAPDATTTAPHVIAGGSARVRELERPEMWIGFDERWMLDLHERAGMRIRRVRYGSWTGRESSGPGFGPKDIVIAVRN